MPFDELVELAVTFRDSRRAAKRFLHERKLPSDAAAVDAADLYLRRRADWPRIDAAAVAALDRRRALADEDFDLRLAIVNRLKVAGYVTRDARARFAADAGVAASDLDAMIDGADVPTSVASKILAALGARRVDFGAR